MATLADYGPEVRAEVKQVREVVATLHEQLIKWNLVVWTAGNVSQRLHTADLMVIKPSGLRYEYLTPSSMVVCDLDGNVVDGSEAPSSDTASHAYIYRHMPDVYGVVHTHSTYATAWAATGQNIPCGLTMMGDEFGGPVPVGPFRLIGSEAIGEGVVETLREYPKSPAVLMQNHGPFTIGKDAESAVKAAAMTEEVAHTMWAARQLGEIIPISDEDIAKLIGRLAFRQMFDAEGYEVVAINDLTSPKMLAHLLKYDTAQGSFCGKIGEGKHTVEATEDSIIVDGKEIKIYAVKDAKDAPWGELNVDVVLECTGFYTSKEKSMAHIQAGAKKVVISAPAGNDLKTIVYSVNEKTLTAEDQVISAASCTTNCLAPMANTLNKTYPIVSGIMTTVHAYTGDQMILDGPQRKGDLRRARAGAQNIVPNTTGAAKAIGLVIPELNGKLIGSAQRVPVPTGSTTILVAVVKGKDVTVESINAAMKAATSESFGYNEDQIVSSDVIGMRYGSLFDATQTMVAKIDDDTYQVQVVSWYDNENSYTSQMVRTIKYFAENC